MAVGYSSRDYGSPTFRLGAICNKLLKLDVDTAKLIRILIKKYWIKEFNNIINTSSKLGLEEIVPPREFEYYEEISEGVILLFPEFVAHSKEYALSIRPSVTTCIKPNRSKIWVRISYIPAEEKGHLSNDELNQFFNISGIVAKELIPIILNIYTQAIEEIYFGEVDKLKLTRFVYIMAASTEFGFDITGKNIVDILESAKELVSQTFPYTYSSNNGSAYKILNEARQDGLLKGLVAYNQSEFIMKILCLVDEELPDSLMPAETTKDFSKYVLRRLAIAV